MEDEAYLNLRNYSLKLLSYRPRSIREVSEKLKKYCIKKKISAETVNQVINYLKEQNFLNDEEFGRWWITQRNSFRPKGYQLIKLELMQKGIDKEIINRVISDTENKGEGEFLTAMKVIEKKRNLLKNLKKDALKAKISRFLGSRGFSWETVFHVIDEVLQKA